MREIRGNLQTDESIDAGRLLVNRPQDVAGILDILDYQSLVDPMNATPFTDQSLDLLVVIIALGDRLMKNGRIGRDAS